MTRLLNQNSTLQIGIDLQNGLKNTTLSDYLKTKSKQAAMTSQSLLLPLSHHSARAQTPPLWRGVASEERRLFFISSIHFGVTFGTQLSSTDVLLPTNPGSYDCSYCYNVILISSGKKLMHRILSVDTLPNNTNNLYSH